MNIKKRGLISVLLILTVVFSLMSLAACNKEEEAEEERMIHVKIVGANNTVLSDLDVSITDVPSAITVYAAINKACIIEDIAFVYNDEWDVIDVIGIYGTQEESDSTTEVDEEGEIIDDGSYWYWGWKVNGEEITGSSAKEKSLSSGSQVLVEWLKAYPEN